MGSPTLADHFSLAIISQRAYFSHNSEKSWTISKRMYDRLYLQLRELLVRLCTLRPENVVRVGVGEGEVGGQRRGSEGEWRWVAGRVRLRWLGSAG